MISNNERLTKPSFKRWLFHSSDPSAGVVEETKNLELLICESQHIQRKMRRSNTPQFATVLELEQIEVKLKL
jgi:hypothetical protein